MVGSTAVGNGSLHEQAFGVIISKLHLNSKTFWMKMEGKCQPIAGQDGQEPGPETLVSMLMS
jgi:hypothetical protein